MKKIVLFLITFFLVSQSIFAYVPFSMVNIVFTLGISEDDIKLRTCGETDIDGISLSKGLELVGSNFREIDCSFNNDEKYENTVYYPQAYSFGDWFLLKGKDGVQAFYIFGVASESGSFWWSGVMIFIYVLLGLAFAVLFILFLGKGFKKVFGLKF